MNVDYLQLARLCMAEILLVLTALLVLGVDLSRRGRGDDASRRAVATWIGILGCAGAFAWLVAGGAEGTTMGGMLALDALTRWVKCVLLVLTGGTLLLSRGIRFTPHLGEYVAVVLFGAVGMLLMASAENMLLLFLALELASVSLYILTAFDKRDGYGMEAALKYFLFGGMAGAFLLFGMSLIYGVSGAIEFRAIATALSTAGLPPLLLAGVVMVFVGLGFKVAAVPFHFWAPDAYQGAPAPVAGFIAGGSKVAAFFVLAKFSAVALAGIEGSGAWGGFRAGWMPVVACLAAASMVVGNFAALAQSNVRRLLAYSAVAHGGYALVGVLAGGADSANSVIFYAATYALTSLGAFGVVGWVEAATGGSDFSHFAGLSRKSPLVALSLGVFLLSLAGIPPLVGFFGKFYLFLAALKSGGAGLGLLWLVILGIATTCVSFFYYLRLLKVVFVDEPTGVFHPPTEAGFERATIAVSAALVVLVGCAPELLLGSLRAAVLAVKW